jgi:hypothetical protein
MADITSVCGPFILSGKAMIRLQDMHRTNSGLLESTRGAVQSALTTGNENRRLAGLLRLERVSEV